MTVAGARIPVLLSLSLAAASLLSGSGCGGDAIYRQRSIAPGEPRRALLVLPGMRQSRKGRRAMRRFYQDRGYDVFIPDYYSRHGLEQTRANLARFIEEQRLADYDELYIFCYMLGAWSLNPYIEEHPLPNLRRVILDRSPIQEQVSRLVLENIPHIIDTFFGDTVEDFHETEYPPLRRGDFEIGLIIECRASPFARQHREQVIPIERTGWFRGAFQQEYNDFMYLYLHHDEMYHSFDVIGDDVLSFFQTGHFTDDARRLTCDRDPFE